MIHYHGCPVSGPRDSAERFYSGRHSMVSFAHPGHLEMIAEYAQSFALDNGAFTTWRSGEQFDFDGYCNWVREWMDHPGFDWALIPDVIAGDEEQNDELLARFVGRFGLLSPIVPVWHLHESIGRLRRLCGSFRRVALGSSGKWRTPGTDTWKARMRDVMSAVVLPNGRPICKLHGLRMLSVDVFPLYPFASADSANAAVNAGSTSRFGQYPDPITAERACSIARRIEIHNSASRWSPIEDTEELLFAEHLG